jgi:hypothetical protein
MIPSLRIEVIAYDYGQRFSHIEVVEGVYVEIGVLSQHIQDLLKADVVSGKNCY